MLVLRTFVLINIELITVPILLWSVVGGQCVVAEIDIEDQIRSSSVLLDSSVVDSRKYSSGSCGGVGVQINLYKIQIEFGCTLVYSGRSGLWFLV